MEYPVKSGRSFLNLFLFTLFSVGVLCIPSGLWAREEGGGRVYFLHALKSKQEGNLLVTENLLKKAIEVEPGNADFHFELGNLYTEENQLEPARMALEQAIMISPGHLAAHYNLGLVYRELGFMGEARGQFEKVLEMDPQNTKARIQIGNTYAAEGFLEDARQAFEDAKWADPTNPEPRAALEDLERLELKARDQSRLEMENRLNKNEKLFSETLLQEFLARRSKAQSQN